MIARLLLLISFLLIGGLPLGVEARRIITTPGVYYIIVDATHARYEELKSQEQAVYDRTRSGNTLSVYLNNARTQALIKVIGADDSWASSAIATSGVVLRVYDYEQHDAVVTLMESPAWARPE